MVRALVQILEQDSLNRRRILEVGLFLAQQGNILNIKVVSGLKVTILSAFIVEALLEQDVVVDGEIGQERPQPFEARFRLEDGLLMRVEE